MRQCPTIKSKPNNQLTYRLNVQDACNSPMVLPSTSDTAGTAYVTINPKPQESKYGAVHRPRRFLGTLGMNVEIVLIRNVNVQQ